MNTKWSGMITIGIFFLVTAIGFFTWIISITLLWSFLNLFDISTNLMAMIGAFSTALAAAAVFGAGFMAYRELSEVAKTRYMEVADRLFVELNSQENIDARRHIFLNLDKDPEKGMKNLEPEDQAAIKKVLNSLDRVAFLTQPGWIPEDVVMPWMHPMIAKSWEKLKPYVLHERKIRNEPYYYEYAFKLAMRCQAWRKKNLKSTDIKWIKNAL